MTVSFAGLKRRRSNFDELEKKFAPKTSYTKDDRFFYPERDKLGNAYAVLRFLPTGVESTPFVKYNQHWFQGPGGWFKHMCRNDLANDHCPVCEANKAIVKPYGDFKAVPKNLQAVVRNRKRGLQFVANVYIVKNPSDPESEGQVHLFRFGKKIMDKILQAIAPADENDDEDRQFDPFCPWSGANFNLRVKKVDGQVNYDSSSWATPAELFEDDADVEALAANINDLQEFTSANEEFYSSYEQQATNLQRVLGADEKPEVPTAAVPEPGEVAAAAEAEESIADVGEPEELGDDLAQFFDEEDDVAF